MLGALAVKLVEWIYTPKHLQYLVTQHWVSALAQGAPCSCWKIVLVQNRRGSTRYFQKSRCGGPRLQAAQVPRGGALARGHPRWTHRRLCSGDWLLYGMNLPAASHGLVLSFGHLYLL